MQVMLTQRSHLGTNVAAFDRDEQAADNDRVSGSTLPSSHRTSFEQTPRALNENSQDTELKGEGTVGLTPILFSISASEGRNVILRNSLGKIAGNLALVLQFGEETLARLQIIDGFADEGHRTGAYYLVRALNVTFYEAMPHPVALKLAQVG